MPFHWCYQETEALMMFLASLPLIGLFFRNLHARWHAKWKTFCSHNRNKCNPYTCSMLSDPSHDHNIDRDETTDPQWKRCGYDSEEAFQKYVESKPKDEPFK